MQAESDARPRSNTRHVLMSGFTIARFAADTVSPANPVYLAHSHFQLGPKSQPVNHRAELLLAMLQLEPPQGALAAMSSAIGMAASAPCGGSSWSMARKSSA